MFIISFIVAKTQLLSLLLSHIKDRLYGRNPTLLLGSSASRLSLIDTKLVVVSGWLGLLRDTCLLGLLQLGINGRRRSAHNHPDEYGAEPLRVYMGGLPKMITTPPKVAPRGPVRSHHKVVTETEPRPYGGGSLGVLCLLSHELGIYTQSYPDVTKAFTWVGDALGRVWIMKQSSWRVTRVAF